VLPFAAPTKASIVASHVDLDLAILRPETPIKERALSISTSHGFDYLQPVSIWGFPSGYDLPVPLVMIGHFAGVHHFPKKSKGSIHWLLSANINPGNSGGPILDEESGEVVGVASTKFSPGSSLAADAPAVLRKQNPSSSPIYEIPRRDGLKPLNLTEIQILALILQELEDLRKRTQLGIATVVRSEDLRQFLKEHKIDP
jgi:hypothetical protein